MVFFHLSTIARVRAFIISLLCSIPLACFGKTLTRQKSFARLYAAAFILYSFDWVFAVSFAYPTLRISVSCMCYFVYMFFVCRQRGFKLFIHIMFWIASIAVSDMCAGLISLRLFSDEIAIQAREFQHPACYVINGLYVAFQLALILVYALFIRRIPIGTVKGGFLRLLRPVLLGGCLLMLFLRLEFLSDAATLPEEFREYLPEFIALVVLLIVGASYVIQDIRYLQQAAQNSALLQHQETQDALLQETRVFRHNIANLLYGFQGTILSGDQAAIEEYYANLVNTCALINNENVVALKRIPSLPVTALLLNKIQAANEENIPFYVFTDEKLAYHTLKDRDMCEILGILLDNALEGTRKSPAPLIIVEFHNAGDDMEIVIRNTFDDASLAKSRDDVSFSITSTKENHTGLGLETVQRILSHNEQALFNLFLQGRYVEASLLLNQ